MGRPLPVHAPVRLLGLEVLICFEDLSLPSKEAENRRSYCGP